MPLLEISIATPDREVLVDITHRVQDALSESAPGLSGMVSIFVPHTTAGVTVNEGADPSVARDIVEGMARLVPCEAGYRHTEGNSDAHIKASLMGSQVAVPVEQGRLRLGTWQSIYLAEFDGPRTRRVWIVPVAAAAELSPSGPARGATLPG
jgi:secondary thiamine-phosphate synthase enzyme